MLIGEMMISLGIVLLLIGFILGIHFIWILGVLLVVVGIALWILGAMGREIGGRRHYF